MNETTASPRRVSRRQVLSGTAAAGVALAGLPTWFLSESEAQAAETQAARQRRRIGPNDTIQVGLIGPGGSKGGYRQGLGVTRGVASHKGTKVIAVCDVDAGHRAEAGAVFGP